MTLIFYNLSVDHNRSDTLGCRPGCQHSLRYSARGCEPFSGDRLRVSQRVGDMKSMVCMFWDMSGNSNIDVTAARLESPDSKCVIDRNAYANHG
jgi:hypothetical protein